MSGGLPYRRLPHWLTLAALLVLAGCQAPEPPTALDAAAVSKDRAQAVVLFIGDGMGVSTVSAARIYAGQQRGLAGEEHSLSFEDFPHVALIKTYNTDLQVPDSAGTMTAMVTGRKTRAGVLSIGPEAARGDCAAARSNILPTLLQQAEDRGWVTGLVSTATITHATPAANYAHSADRNWESDADMPAEAIAAGCRDIAQQLIDYGAQGNGVDVILGGGRSAFFPESAADPEYPEQSGARADGRDLVAEWLAAGNERRYVDDSAGLRALSTAPIGQVLGLFEPSHMQFEADRGTGPDGEPSLEELTGFAIDRLRKLADGAPFFLMVEAGRIDHAHHFNNAYRALEDTLALDAAVARAVADLGDSALILVTADHSHTFTFSGYPARGNPMLGLVRGLDGSAQKDLRGRPYTTLGYANGPGFAPDAEPLTDAMVQDPSYQQAVTYPLRSETHAGEDVAAYARGPGAQKLHGVMEQNLIYDVLAASAWGTK